MGPSLLLDQKAFSEFVYNCIKSSRLPKITWVSIFT